LKLTGAQAIAQAMKMHGVQYVAGIPGRDCLPLLDALLDAGRDIPFIQVMQSRSAVHLADGFHRACGRPMAVVGGVSGNDLAIASDVGSMTEHSSAALLLRGYAAVGKYFPKKNPPRKASNTQIGMNTFGTAPKRWNPRNARELLGVLPLALGDLLASQPSPVQLDVSLEVQVEQIDVDVSLLQSVGTPELPDTDESLIEQAAALLGASVRPVLFVGIGAVTSNASEILVKLASKAGAAVVTTASAKGVIAEDHPLSGLSAGRFGTGVGNSILARADLILVAGCTDSDWAAIQNSSGSKTSTDAQKLITLSPGSVSGKQPRLCINADLSRSLSGIAQSISTYRSRRALAQHSSWLAVVQQLKARWLRMVADRSGLLKTPFPAQRPIAKLQELMSRDGLIVAGPGTALIAVQQVFRAYAPRTQLTCANSPVTGWAVPAAIGAKLAVPARDVVCIVGDGDFLQSIPEMAVCVMHSLPLVFVVLNNCGHMSTRLLQQKLLGRHVGSEFNLPNGRPYSPNFSDIARSFGLEAWRVEYESQLESALSRALSSGGPALVEVLTEREDTASLTECWDGFGYEEGQASTCRPERSFVE
jgi:acetolactate synthase-1/2/3 large subunit